ncbi:MAG: protein kinase domain-containing protein [Nannocystaceae bacterium]|nr:protein kinase [bacterium]
MATEDALRTLAPNAPSAASLSPRMKELGRYIVVRTLGAGAMGTVYLAYDPELDRKVALKLLLGADSPKRRLALLREAQALAKLTHPNVVAVHDVGEHDGNVYVAMELVEGVTLREWLALAPRSWRGVLDVFLEACRGLEAAHRRGLIHRDFKPDNVMIADSGRVLVMDFGLARPTTEAQREGDDALEDLSGSLLTEATVGRVAGTPAYMAPEQALASGLSPAADQFAFCVSLWEALYGRRPFDGPTYPELLRNTAEGRFGEMPSNRRVPRWLRRVLAKGLRADADRRWSSLDALARALERGRTQWRWKLAVAAASALAISLAFVARQRRQERQSVQRAIAACKEDARSIREVWSEDAQERLRSGLRATGVSFADDSADTLIPWLDAYTDAWQRGQFETCVRSSVNAEWSAKRADRAMWCFEDRRGQLAAAVDQISEGDATTARRAVRIASYLDPIDACLDPDLIDRLPAPPADIREQIRDVRAQLIESDSLRHGGDPLDAADIAHRARGAAESLDWPPVLAASLFTEGRALLEAGQWRRAEPLLTEAFFTAEEAGSHELAFRAARSLVMANGKLQRFRQAEVWSRHAELVSGGKPDPGRLDEAEGLYLMMSIDRSLGRYEQAAARGERAVELRSQTLGPRHPITAAAMRNLGLVYLEQGRGDEALPLLEHAFEVWRDTVGDSHPSVDSLRLYRGEALLLLERPEEALELIDTGRRGLARSVPEVHPESARGQLLLGRAHLVLGNLDASASAFDEALPLFEQAYGLRHQATAGALLAASDLDRARGDDASARLKCVRAQEILALTLRDDHPDRVRAAEAIAAIDREGSP